jgi:hypothetical protein
VRVAVVGMAMAVMIVTGSVNVAMCVVVAVVATGRGAGIILMIVHFTAILPVRTTRRRPPASLVGSLTLLRRDSIDAIALDCEHLNEASLLSLSVLE